MDFEPPEGSQSGGEAPCSICLEQLADHSERSIAKLRCGHKFHLDCIGSAFNAKGSMQCPNCRKIENGQWLYASGHRTSSDFDLDAWMSEGFIDFRYTETPFGYRWCPLRELRHLASLIELEDALLNSLGNTYGDHGNTSSSSHICPLLALNGYHAMHANPSSSNSADSVMANSALPRHQTSPGAGRTSLDILLHQHRYFLSLLENQSGQTVPQFVPRLSRTDASSQQRLGSFVHPPPVHGFGSRSGSNLAASAGMPVMGALRSHTQARSHGTNHQMYHQAFPQPVRRSPNAVTFVSSLAATSSSAEVGGFYGFASVSSSSSNRSHRQPESMVPRHDQQLYGWGSSSRDGVSSLPWIPMEGESQWWGPFNPNQVPQSGGSYVPRGNTADSGSQRPAPPRMPPYM